MFTDGYQPQTRVEQKLIAECRVRARATGLPMIEILTDAAKWWATTGRACHPGQWRSRVQAAERMLAQRPTS